MSRVAQGVRSVDCAELTGGLAVERCVQFQLMHLRAFARSGLEQSRQRVNVRPEEFEDEATDQAALAVHRLLSLWARVFLLPRVAVLLVSTSR